MPDLRGEAVEPMVVIDEKYIDERNITNVADAINELPGVRGSVTPSGAQGSFGQGVNFVNNFGLGSNRTLTLVNGRRFVSSNVPTLFNQGSAGTQVDLNGNEIRFSGVQAAMNYTTSLDGLHLPGSLEVTGDLLYVKKRLVDNTGIAPLRTDGTFGDPKYAAQLNFRYIHPDFGVSTSLNYVGDQWATRAARNTDLREFNELDEYVTVNLGFYIDAGKQFRFSGSVTNLFNRQGEEYRGVLAPVSCNDLLGRRFAVSARYRM